MRKNFLVLAGLFLIVMCSVASASTVDLTTWSQKGSSSAGTWAVSPDGSSVYQSINGEPTYFVSDTNYINTKFEGSFGQVGSGGNWDDDYIGFVFGWNDTNDYYLFDWKQRDQCWSGMQAYEGFTLSKISGTNVKLWDHTGDDIQILASSFSTTSGWVDNTTYDFTLDYTTTGLSISIDENQIFAIAGTFATGKFGFYNYSQSDVKYQGFEEKYVPPTVPEPATFILLGSGLAGLAFYRRKRK